MRLNHTIPLPLVFDREPLPSRADKERQRKLQYLREWKTKYPDAHRKWADKNLAHLAAYAREYRKKKRETDPEWVKKQAESRVAYKKANHTKMAAEVARWKREHPEYRQAKASRRRAHKAAAPVNDLTIQQWRDIVSRYGSHCAYCAEPADPVTLDHVVPLSKGGGHTALNVVPACHPCNSRKRDSTDWVPMTPEQVHGCQTDCVGSSHSS